MTRSYIMKSTVVLTVLGTVLFIACGGGGGGSTGPAERIAFVTSTFGTGDLSTWADAGMQTGLAAADAVCQARADAAGLPGSFVAWMSDSTDDAYCRAHGLSGTKDALCGQLVLPASAGPWVKVDGTPFAERLDVALDDGVVYTPVNVNEMGNVLSGGYGYWTGNISDGEAGVHTCSDWSDASTSSGHMGNTAATTYRWSAGSTSGCSAQMYLLCLETGSNNSLPAYGDTGKTVFLSSAVGNGRLGSWAQAGGETGVAAGDAICQALASDASLPRATSFKAWLSDSSTDAVSHITSDGPWVRLDGIKVADNMSSLVNTGALTSISLTETGEYENNSVFTGTLDDGTLAASACSDWTSNSGLTGVRGSSAFAEDSWSEWLGPSSCGNNLRLYCFED